MGILHLANELRLLRCTFTASHQLPSQQDSEAATQVESSQAPSDGNQNVEFNWDTCLQNLVEQIEAGNYFQALASQRASALLGPGSSGSFKQGGSQAENKAWFSAQKVRIKELVSDQFAPIEVTEDDKDTQELFLLGAGVASLLAFLQANLTGPQVEGSAISANSGDVVEDADEWARQQLMIDGSDLLGKLFVPEYLILAKYLLVDMKPKPAGFETRSWWALRTLLTHQRCLAERSPSLQSLLRAFSSTVLSSFGTTEAVQAQEWGHILLSGEARILAAAAQLEAGFVEHAFGHDNKARACFERAEQTCGLELSVTGALGFRTIYQTDAKAQMVLLATSNSTAGAELDTWRRTSDVDTNAKNNNSDILLAPKLVEEGWDGDVVLETEESSEGGSKVLSTIEQAVVLAKGLDVQRSNPDDELRTWQMAPYIEAVNSQQQSDPMVRAFCELLRIRWERMRSRTKERAYAMMEELAEEIRRGTTKIALRMCHVFSVAFPMMPTFLKEQAELMVSFGLVGEAMRVFEELELWNNLIDCYTLLGKKAAAVDLINQRLKSHPNDPRLWCSLGDVTLSDECYRKAWAVSNQHYARAQRSLGRTAYARKDYEKSMEHWKLALNLNPLHPDGWFALGSAAVKAHDVDTAINAFTRSVQLDPDNGESWNNLAALNMVRKRSKEAFVAFREALKYKRNSWQMWENFAQVSVDVSNFGQAVQALNKVLELSEGKRTDLITLTKIVEEVERLKSTATVADSTDLDSHEHGDASTIGQVKIADLDIKQNEAHPPRTDETAEQIRASREALTLFEMTGKLLNQVVQSKVSGGEVWGLKARWHHANGDLMMCTEAALKQVRAFQSTSWQQNQEKFESFATASLQLCEAYIESSEKGGSAKEVSAAIMHLRNTLKQGQQFSAIDKYKVMEACLLRAEKIKASLLAKQRTA